MADKKVAVFDIEIGEGSHDTRVRINGEDLTAAIGACSVSVRAGRLTAVRLTPAHLTTRVRLQAALDASKVVIVDPTKKAKQARVPDLSLRTVKR